MAIVVPSSGLEKAVNVSLRFVMVGINSASVLITYYLKNKQKEQCLLFCTLQVLHALEFCTARDRPSLGLATQTAQHPSHSHLYSNMSWSRTAWHCCMTVPALGSSPSNHERSYSHSWSDPK